MSSIAVPRQQGRDAEFHRVPSIPRPSVAEVISLTIVVGIFASAVYVLGFYLR